ncbi:MAG: hypothetical protein AAFX78_02640 [Cyanobacteria bacterium J06638_20]
MAREPEPRGGRKKPESMTSRERLKHIRDLEMSIALRDQQFADLRDSRDKDREYIASLEQRLAQQSKWHLEAAANLEEAEAQIEALNETYDKTVNDFAKTAAALEVAEQRITEAEQANVQLTGVKNSTLVSSMNVERALKDAFEQFGRGLAEGMKP